MDNPDSFFPSFDKDFKRDYESKNKNLLLSSFEKLNISGQGVAIKRVDELAEIPRYQKKEGK